MFTSNMETALGSIFLSNSPARVNASMHLKRHPQACEAVSLKMGLPQSTQTKGSLFTSNAVVGPVNIVAEDKILPMGVRIEV